MRITIGLFLLFLVGCAESAFVSDEALALAKCGDMKVVSIKVVKANGFILVQCRDGEKHLIKRQRG